MGAKVVIYLTTPNIFRKSMFKYFEVHFVKVLYIK